MILSLFFRRDAPLEAARDDDLETLPAKELEALLVVKFEEARVEED